MKFSVVAAFIVIVLFFCNFVPQREKKGSHLMRNYGIIIENYSVDNLISVYGGALCLERIKQQLKQRQVMI